MRIPYDGSKDYFSLWVYLKSIGEDFNTSLVNHFTEIEAEVILKKIADSLKRSAYNVITGDEWLTGYWSEW